MTDLKSRFYKFLENASAALPDTFSASVLSNTPNVRDEDEHEEDPEELLKAKLELAMKEPPEADDEDNDKKLHAKLFFQLLRGELGQDGLDDFHDTDDHVEGDAPVDTDVEVEKADDDKHNQLLNAINDLRQELTNMKSGTSQPQQPHEEENEESYEEDEQEDTKQATARQLFSGLVNQGKSRQEIIDQFMKQIGVTNSTAVSYYQRLAKEAGLTGSGDREMPGQQPGGLGVAAGMDPQQGMPSADGQQGMPGMEQQPPESNIDGFEVQDDPNRQGLIRTVKGAHLVYKRKNEEGTFDELWVFGTGGDMNSSLEVRRNILAGTDIPPRAIKSENGGQSYTLTSMGNGQVLHIKGLPN